MNTPAVLKYYPADRKGCENCKHCKEHKYIYECKIGRATECTWDNEWKLWEDLPIPDFIEEEEMTI